MANIINDVITKNNIDYIIEHFNDEYDNFRIKKSNNLININENNNDIIDISNYNNLIIYNYKVAEIKNNLKKYKLKVTGNKNELLRRLYNYLKTSSFVVKIQKLFRGYLPRKLLKLRGDALKNRNLCVNKEDFLTMDNLNDISTLHFYSYKDDNLIYGFDIISIYNLIEKVENKEVKNPYTRKPINDNILRDVKSIIRLCKIMKTPININIKIDDNELSQKKKMELKTLEIFQYMNSLGNYSDPNWFLSLNRNQLIRFYKELNEIWNYRANLSEEVKINICPPRGVIFTFNDRHIIYSENNILVIQNKLLNIIQKMVFSGIDNDSKILGSYYVLGALTLVSQNAANSLSWLFQSVYY